MLTEQSIIEILNFFEQYNLATGTTINITKTTITPLPNAKIYNIDKKIQNVKINDPQDFVKILGIHKKPTNNQYLQLEYMSKSNRKTNTTTFQTTSVFKRKSHTSEFLDFIQNNLLK